MDMEENNNAQPVAESTGTQVCKECGRTLPLEDFQRRRYGKRDKVCKACRAEKIRVGMATGKEKKDLPAQEPVEILKTADFSDAALLEELRRRGYKGSVSKCVEVEI